MNTHFGNFSHVLVTGATGLVGSHVVDNLLAKGFKVRAVVRSKDKADAFRKSRKLYTQQLDFYFIRDLTDPDVFVAAVEGIDGVLHIASPLKYDIVDKEKELVVPAIRGVLSLLDAAAKSKVKRIVLTSSFGAVLDMGRPESTPWTYSGNDWNPITYDETVAPQATPQDAYRGSKTFAEQEAWNFVDQRSPGFDLVTLCPSMIFGPLATSPTSPNDLNESNKMLWKVATRGPLEPLPLPLQLLDRCKRFGRASRVGSHDGRRRRQKICPSCTRAVYLSASPGDDSNAPSMSVDELFNRCAGHQD
ncbi:3-beta hydroxysteroid dehydrogenase isomerase family protein [Colletotrichum sojae]|uniref:3-beta hydroxysteroid dehydrogenase isomerase family protein n=1 Tax=Colletotrichum sojae TaxID=2175907 RepID=A0A8H6IN03_9PEZI|nr:3-beta hydroxysteroid dehydrogenase isomerase family protein [Colletotrichum sojae]